MAFPIGILGALGSGLSGLGSAFSGGLDRGRDEDLVNNDLFKQIRQDLESARPTPMFLYEKLSPTEPVPAEPPASPIVDLNPRRKIVFDDE